MMKSGYIPLGAITLEQLEHRMLLVVAPIATSCTIQYQQVDGATDLAFINWTDTNSAPNNETGYRVEYSADAGSSWTSITPDFAADSTQGSQVLDAGQRYRYRVRAVDGGTTSSPSNVVIPQSPQDLVVEVTATIETGGTLVHWTTPLKPRHATYQYNVYRKAKGASSWGSAINGSPIASNVESFLDDDVDANTAYEYRVERHYTALTNAHDYGYVYAGALELVENRGTVLLVIDSSMFDQVVHTPTDVQNFVDDLKILKKDLVGDGWRVVEASQDGYVRGVERDENDVEDSVQTALQAPTIKGIIKDAYDAESGLDAIMLIGHIPVPYSGVFQEVPGYSGIHADSSGAWSSDTYYVVGLDDDEEDMDDHWTTLLNRNNVGNNRPQEHNATGDGKYDQMILEGDAVVPIGRIDFANLPIMRHSFPHLLSGDPISAEDAEIRLLHRYFEKDHRWRMADPEATVPVSAMIDDQLGPNISRDAWMDFAPLVGPDNVDSKDWESTLHTEDYLWAFGTGGGSNISAANVTHTDHFANTVTGGPAEYNAVFQMLWGSYFGDWNLAGHNQGANIMRAMLGTEGKALTISWGGAPYWFYHTMALGEPIGQSAVLTQNNHGGQLVYTPVGENQGAPFVELLGDPTLRMTIVKPIDVSEDPVTETIDLSNGHVTLAWNPSPEDEPDNDFIGYQVYRSDSLTGVFTAVGTRISATLDDSPYTFNDTSPAGKYVYMVRAIKLETTYSGTYENASTGVFASEVILQGSSGTQNIYVKREVDGDDDAINVWKNSTGTGTVDYALDARVVDSITFNGGAGDDVLTIDHGGDGSPVPSGGIDFNAASGNTGDTLKVFGTSGANTVSFTSNTVTFDSTVTTYDSDLDVLLFDGKLGSDNVTISSSHASGLKVEFPASQKLDELHVASGRTAAMSTDGTHVLDVTTLALSPSSGNPTATLDLNDNDLIVRAASSPTYGSVSSLIAYAYHAGDWDRAGIFSKAASESKKTMLGTLTYTQFYAIYTSSTFDGVAIASGDVLVKFTYYGDTDFNGVVNFDDYSRVDNGFNYSLSGWMNGDVDYNGVVNFDDYSHVDHAFATQSGALRPGEGGANPALVELGQMDHFTQSYMNAFIDYEESLGNYYTEFDFFPDGTPW